MHARRLANVLIPLLLAAPLDAQVPRLCGDLVLTYDAGLVALTLTPIDGAPARRLNFAQAPEPFEAIMLRDYVVRSDGRLAVSAAGVLPGQGGMANLIMEFDTRDLNRPGTIRNTGPVVCALIEASGGSLWCLGPDMPALMRGQDYGVLYRFDDGEEKPAVMLKRGQLPREATQSPWARPAQLLAAPGGGVVALMPGVRRMARVGDGEPRVLELPWEPRSHSVVSAALDPRGRLFALLPLAENEKFDTPYGLFRRQGNRWIRIAGDADVLRGTRLLAVSDQTAVLIDRLNKVSTIPLGAEPAGTP
ncbi:MAG: hypothetical protein KJZ84_06715 [Bryobacteraceae bacterium]|nr:hypothetical protein [Bryobacteraceae bacterium]